MPQFMSGRTAGAMPSPRKVRLRLEILISESAELRETLSAARAAFFGRGAVIHVLLTSMAGLHPIAEPGHSPYAQMRPVVAASETETAL